MGVDNRCKNSIQWMNSEIWIRNVRYCEGKHWRRDYWLLLTSKSKNKFDRIDNSILPEMNRFTKKIGPQILIQIADDGWYWIRDSWHSNVPMWHKVLTIYCYNYHNIWNHLNVKERHIPGQLTPTNTILRH